MKNQVDSLFLLTTQPIQITTLFQVSDEVIVWLAVFFMKKLDISHLFWCLVANIFCGIAIQTIQFLKKLEFHPQHPHLPLSTQRN